MFEKREEKAMGKGTLDALDDFGTAWVFLRVSLPRSFLQAPSAAATQAFPGAALPRI